VQVDHGVGQLGVVEGVGIQRQQLVDGGGERGPDGVVAQTFAGYDHVFDHSVPHVGLPGLSRVSRGF
jgi:hypothetical protein